MHGASSDDPAVDDTAQAQQAAVAPSTIDPSPGTTVPILPTGQPLPVVVAPNTAGAPAAETRTSVDGVAPRTRTVADLRGGEPSTTPTASSGTAAVTGSMERARPEPLAVPSATLGTDARASSGQSIAAPVRAAAGSGRATMPTGGASTAPAVSVLPAADLVAPLGMSTPAMVAPLRTATVPATPPAIAVAAPVATVPVVVTGDAGPTVAALAPSPATAPAPALPSLATGAAGRVFAAALHAAAGSAAKADAGSGDDHDPVVAAMLAGTTAAGAAPLATQQGAAIDLRHAAWPTRMAEQIEALRDAADAASTTVRINPDALGPVELEVRRDGDRLHVHFTAAHPETRTLIADAQPQLAAAAAERGLKLGQTSVGGDTAGWGAGAGGGQTSGQPQGDQTARRAPTPRMPTRTATRSASDDAHIDTRIA